MRPGMIFNKKASVILSVAERFFASQIEHNMPLILSSSAPLLSNLLASAVGLLKWLTIPVWGPVALAHYLSNLMTAFLLGRRSAEAAELRTATAKRRHEARENRRASRPRLLHWLGLPLAFYLVKRFLGGTVNGFLTPFLLSRFVLRRLWEAKAYIDDQKKQKLRRKAYLEEEERQRDRDAIQRAEQERQTKLQDNRRREEASRILVALRSF